jgi:hypothetical protein
MKSVAFLVVSIFSIFWVPFIWADDYVPDIIELDGTNSLSFPPDPALVLAGGATIEFWISPDWQEIPDYEPVILSNTGEEGPSYLVAMLPNKQGLAIYTGTQRLEASFDFTDNQMHFVAIVDLGDTINILVDNLLIADSELTFAPLPSSGFWIGTADGEKFPFIGAIAGLRIWDTPLDPYDLIEFAMKDINDPSVLHPDIDSLVGVSKFHSQSFSLTGLIQ